MAFDDTGAEWISDKKKIQNPYFGPEMPKCGTTKMAYNEE
jgi:Cu(I)/Ag(I) efflux system membrane fusion protein